MGVAQGQGSSGFSCPAGTGLQYFSAGSYMYIGNPPIGRLECKWSGTQSILPTTCPFQQRIANTSSYMHTQSDWDCGVNSHHCWYTSKTISGKRFLFCSVVMTLRNF